MKIATEDHLLKLVRLTDKAEARHFRLLCRMQNGKKSYEHLYDEVIKVKDGEDYDETVLRYIGKLSKCHLPKEEREIFKTFLRDIEALEKKLRVACGQKEVKRWVRSKLSGRPMADLLREESKS